MKFQNITNVLKKEVLKMITVAGSGHPTLLNAGIKVKTLSVNKIPHSGTNDELLKKYGLNWKGIIKAIGKF